MPGPYPNQTDGTLWRRSTVENHSWRSFESKVFLILKQKCGHFLLSIHRMGWGELMRLIFFCPTLTKQSSGGRIKSKYICARRYTKRTRCRPVMGWTVSPLHSCTELQVPQKMGSFILGSTYNCYHMVFVFLFLNYFTWESLVVFMLLHSFLWLSSISLYIHTIPS